MARIEDYALLGDLQTAALVGLDGSVDWLCLPRFDSPACFAALLGGHDAGYWKLAPAGGRRATRRRYRGPTLVLDTEWATREGRVRITDFMPPRGEAPDLIRIVEGLDGRVPMRMELKIRFDYGDVIPWVRRREGGLTAVAGPDFLRLATPVELLGHHMMTEAQFDVSAGQKVPFVLTHTEAHLDEPREVLAEHALADTVNFWSDWIDRCAYDGRWHDAVHRALVTLKALTYSPTGGIAAAATTSLPEQPRGCRNWDYRYCWLRDATFTLQALLGTGFLDEARAWREWLLRAVAGDPSRLQIMYGSTVRGASPSTRWTGCPGTSAPPRCEPATAPPDSSSSTCGARSSTACTPPVNSDCRALTAHGICSGDCWISSRATGIGPTAVCGNFGDPNGISCIPR